MPPIRVLDICAGTGSVSKFCDLHPGRFEVTSLDIRAVGGFTPTILCSLLDWKYTDLPPDSFDIIWASPPCTMYSNARRRAKLPRDLVGSDKLVDKVQEIMSYFSQAANFMENPYSGLLRHRDVVQGLYYVRKDYCQYGLNYMKPTAIWTNCHSVKRKSCPGILLQRCDKHITGKNMHYSTMSGNFRDNDQKRACLLAGQKQLTGAYKRGVVPQLLLHELFNAACAEEGWDPLPMRDYYVDPIPMLAPQPA